MGYADKAKTKTKLSKHAKQAFQVIARTLIEKAEREQRIPETIRLHIETDAGRVNAELTAAGIIHYQFTDLNGAKVYDHIVDQDALKETLPHLKRH